MIPLKEFEARRVRSLFSREGSFSASCWNCSIMPTSVPTAHFEGSWSVPSWSRTQASGPQINRNDCFNIAKEVVGESGSEGFHRNVVEGLKQHSVTKLYSRGRVAFVED